MLSKEARENIFREIYSRFLGKMANVKLNFERETVTAVDWSDRMVCIRGPRGCGKTTFVLQYIKKNFKLDGSVLYVSLDDLYFSTHSLLAFAEDFVSFGGTHLFLDEIHKYANWSIELKNIYDSCPELKVVLTGSSILEINKGKADLSRRVVTYDMSGLSFREFLKLEAGLKLEVFSLEDILARHLEISMMVTEKCKPLPLFHNYLTYGYYPYFLENKNTYAIKLGNTANLILETDLPALYPIEYGNIIKLKKLLGLLSSIGPYKPDINKLSGQVEVSRNTLLHFLMYLKEACLLNLLKDADKGESILTKPEKVYLHNTNLAYAFGANTADTGMMREVFFLNQVSAKYPVHHTKVGDFKVAGKYLFEVGGKGKTFDQIKGLPNSYIAVGEIEHGFGSKIPLWMFGLLY